ncbi:MAG: hypothetical protein JWP21_1279 [Tardiphaga sp.]|nr:hypothetical protein [Tardiphaga sp.]
MATARSSNSAAAAAARRVVRRKTPKKPVRKTKAVPAKAVKAKAAAAGRSSRAKVSRPKPIDDPPATGVELITRVNTAIERELNQIEVIVGGHRLGPSARTEAERRARTLASLARTLSEVARLRARHQQKADDDDDDPVPSDLDEFRETLARRLEKLLADRSQPPDCEPEPA